MRYPEAVTNYSVSMHWDPLRQSQAMQFPHKDIPWGSHKLCSFHALRYPEAVTSYAVSMQWYPEAVTSFAVSMQWDTLRQSQAMQFPCNETPWGSHKLCSFHAMRHPEAVTSSAICTKYLLTTITKGDQQYNEIPWWSYKLNLQFPPMTGITKEDQQHQKNY